MYRRLSSMAVSEIRSARRAKGLSQRAIAEAVGLSASQVARFERGSLHDLRLGQLCSLSAAVGLDPSLRFFPQGDPVRDAGHVRLLERLRTQLPTPVRWRVEVPLPGYRDGRAWDARLDGTGCQDAVEAETRIADLQAVERRAHLKARDDATVRHVFLLVADTRHNREAMRAGREGLRTQFPLDSREALGELRRGRCPGANAILIV